MATSRWQKSKSLLHLAGSLVHLVVPCCRRCASVLLNLYRCPRWWAILLRVCSLLDSSCPGFLDGGPLPPHILLRLCSLLDLCPLSSQSTRHRHPPDTMPSYVYTHPLLVFTSAQEKQNSSNVVFYPLPEIVAMCSTPSSTLPSLLKSPIFDKHIFFYRVLQIVLLSEKQKLVNHLTLTTLKYACKNYGDQRVF